MTWVWLQTWLWQLMANQCCRIPDCGSGKSTLAEVFKHLHLRGQCLSPRIKGNAAIRIMSVKSFFAKIESNFQLCFLSSSCRAIQKLLWVVNRGLNHPDVGFSGYPGWLECLANCMLQSPSSSMSRPPVRGCTNSNLHMLCIEEGGCTWLHQFFRLSKAISLSGLRAFEGII